MALSSYDKEIYMAIDATMNNTENALSDAALWPVIGILPGGVKILMGVTQSVTALACGIITLAPAAASENWSLVHHSWTHIKHGLGNIAAGTLEALPFVGTCMYYTRKLKQASESDAQSRILTHHENKWMPYDSLVARDLSISSHDESDSEGLNQAFECALNERGGRVALSSEEITKIAETILYR